MSPYKLFHGVFGSRIYSAKRGQTELRTKPLKFLSYAPGSNRCDLLTIMKAQKQIHAMHNSRSNIYT